MTEPAKKMISNPIVPNRPGIEMEVIAWMGQFKPGKYKAYYCKSHPIRVERDKYPPAEKENLERGIGWEIYEVFPFPRQDSYRKFWETVRRARFAVSLPEAQENIWPMILQVVSHNFSKPSQVQAEARFIEY